MISTFQTSLAIFISLGIAWFLLVLHRGARAENLRRSKLPLDEQRRLAADDAQWQQRYSP